MFHAYLKKKSYIVDYVYHIILLEPAFYKPANKCYPISNTNRAKSVNGNVTARYVFNGEYKQIVGFLLNAIKLKCLSNTCEYSFNGLMHPHQNQLQPTHFTADYARIETACY